VVASLAILTSAMNIHSLRALAVSSVTLLLVSSSLLIWLARAADDPFPEGPGKAVFVKVCSPCHALDIIAGLRHSKGEWQTLVYSMKAMGADATDKECDVITDYLAKNFPKNEDEKKNEKK
jgi:cytochrome c5